MANPKTIFQSEDVIMLKWIIINKVEDNEDRELWLWGEYSAVIPTSLSFCPIGKVEPERKLMSKAQSDLLW